MGGEFVQAVNKYRDSIVSFDSEWLVYLVTQPRVQLLDQTDLR